MKTTSSLTLNRTDAEAQVTEWLNARSDESRVLNLISNGVCFQLGSDFDHSSFVGQLGHAYFGLKTVPQSNGTLLDEWSLLFIPENQDSQTAPNPAPYIYRAPYINNGPLLGTLNPSTATEEHSRWMDEHHEWVNYMIHTAEDGVTLVADVPTDDITTFFEEHDNLFVYLGLRNDNSPEYNLSFLFFDGDSGHFLELQAADFITPKPPFGMGDNNKYSLLQNYF